VSDQQVSFGLKPLAFTQIYFSFKFTRRLPLSTKGAPPDSQQVSDYVKNDPIPFYCGSVSLFRRVDGGDHVGHSFFRHAAN
jgi:hypothetical protein